MARLIFDIISEFEEWARVHCTDRNYEVYHTEQDELLLYPRKSTRPVTYAYISAPKDSASIIKKTLTSLGIKVWEVKRIEWADDRGIGVPLPAE